MTPDAGVRDLTTRHVSVLGADVGGEGREHEEILVSLVMLHILEECLDSAAAIQKQELIFVGDLIQFALDEGEQFCNLNVFMSKPLDLSRERGRLIGDGNHETVLLLKGHVLDQMGTQMLILCSNVLKPLPLICSRRHRDFFPELLR